MYAQVCSVQPVYQGNKWDCPTGWTITDLSQPAVTDNPIPQDVVYAVAGSLLFIFILGYFFRVLVGVFNLRRM